MAAPRVRRVLAETGRQCRRDEVMAGRGQVPRIGEVVRRTGALVPWLLLGPADAEVEPVTAFVRDKVLSDASALTCRSYGHDLLRWFRLLWHLDVPVGKSYRD